MDYTNNSVVTITDIGTDSAAALLCTTTLPGCCFSRQGNEWYLPNGTPLSNTDTQPYYRTRTSQPGTVLLHRNLRATLTGVFRCDIPDASGGLQSLYVGIYDATTGESCTFRRFVLQKLMSIHISWNTCTILTQNYAPPFRVGSSCHHCLSYIIMT